MSPVKRTRRPSQTKIIATLGPASSSYEQIKALFDAGADVFRLNFSHGTHEDHRARYALIRALEKEFSHPIAILADLQGPKLRVGTFKNTKIILKAGQTFRLDMSPQAGDETRVHLPHPEIFAAINEGAELLLDDGKVRLRVTCKGADFADTLVMAGTALSDRKGVNVPTVILPLSALTEKDHKDLTVALEMGVDWIALSFVQRPEDVEEAKAIIKGRAGLIAKIEKPSAVKHLKKIVEVSDAIMVARGDLGVEMPLEDVPSIQKRIISKARSAGKPVIVATQMLESMISAPTPTRAETSDVATAVYDGADAVMLSAETASGAYPLEAVTMMDRIISRVEDDAFYRAQIATYHPSLQHNASDAITAAARQVAETVEAVAIVTYTTSGSTTLRAARERPQVPIICLTSKVETARRLVLSYGVYPIPGFDAKTFNEMVLHACQLSLEHGLAKPGDKLVITAGVPFGTPGSTNILRIVDVTE
ncbi:MAG: pyruvate kinase [Alphaproteobacteria bacterium]|nr:pyruvate kinase [Alphaproteobacteria bacterium]